MDIVAIAYVYKTHAPTVYGPFPSKEAAEAWMKVNCPGREYHITRIIKPT